MRYPPAWRQHSQNAINHFNKAMELVSLPWSLLRDVAIKSHLTVVEIECQSLADINHKMLASLSPAA